MSRRRLGAAVARTVGDPRVQAALRAVDRRDFVPSDLADMADADAPVPIGEGQTTSQPSLVAQMLEAAEISPSDRVLEIGTGMGYQTALLCHLASEVVSIERYPNLAAAARQHLASAGLDALVLVGDGSAGAPEHGPFDAIVSGAAAPEVPPSWPAQLVDGGRLVAPVGGRHEQVVEVGIAHGGELASRRPLVGVRFVPLVEGPVGGPLDSGRRRRRRGERRPGSASEG